jgi:ATP-binding cassette subfamily B protein
MASTTRVLDLLDTEIGIVEGDVEIENVSGEIEYREVTFAYPGRSPIYDDLNLSVQPGESIGIVGSTGAGKTTMMSLMMRLHDPVSGGVFLDGHDVKVLTLNCLRGSIALVSQNTTLFPGSVKDNILYGRPNADDDEILKAATVAEAIDFIQALPQGWDTEIGEDGHRLSGGQRQRIAIARAVLKDAPILVLDEATSNVDNETEAALQRSVEILSKDRTTIIIAHRLSTIRNADRIAVLDGGVISEIGSHEQLVQAKGLYSRLWDVQTGQA